MRSLITAVCCLTLALGVLSAQDMGKKEDAMKDNSDHKEMKMSKGMSMDAKDCPHCTKDKKCAMHAGSGAKKHGVKKTEKKKEEGTKK